jgi:hypothetical protein
MTTVALGSPLPSGACLTRAMIPAQGSPRLGELMVPVGRVPGREEDHVVAVAKRHELQTPKPDHPGQREWTFRVSHLEKWQENNIGTNVPYLARQLSASGPVGVLSQRVNQMLCVPNLDGDARRIHGVLSWFGQKRPYVQRGGGSIVFPCT